MNCSSAYIFADIAKTWFPSSNRSFAAHTKGNNIQHERECWRVKLNFFFLSTLSFRPGNELSSVQGDQIKLSFFFFSPLHYFLAHCKALSWALSDETLINHKNWISYPSCHCRDESSKAIEASAMCKTNLLIIFYLKSHRSLQSTQLTRSSSPHSNCIPCKETSFNESKQRMREEMESLNLIKEKKL